MTTATTGVELIRTERIRQVSVKGWTEEHDDEHIEGELARAGAAYALATCFGQPGPHDVVELCDDVWPFEDGEGCKWTPCYRALGDPHATSGATILDLQIRDLTRGGALIAAELDRLLRIR